MNYKERLKQYLEEDAIYNEYKSGKCDMSDFDKFCIEHCKDIECLLNENQELKKQLDELQTLYNNMFKCHCNRVQVETLLSQQKEFIEWLEQNIENEEYCYLAQNPNERCRKDVFEEVLSKYKEIIGVKDE